MQGLLASLKQKLSQEIEAKFRALAGPESDEDESSNGDDERTEVSPALSGYLANCLGDAPNSSFHNLAEEFSTSDKAYLHLSRHFEDGIEWELNRSMFEKICGFFGFPQIDLFSSRINDQINTYASWKRDPHASYVDAFSVNWTQFTNSYIFPSFA